MTAQEGLPPAARRKALAVLLFTVAMSSLDSSIVNLALPGIARDTGTTAADAVWVVTAFQLAALVTLLPYTMAGDRLGYSRIYLFGVGLFSFASAIAFFADSLPVLIAARALQGMGAGGIMAVNAALLRLAFPKDLFGRALGMTSAVIAGATAAGPTLAAAILSVASWHWLFAASIPLGLGSVVLGRSCLPQGKAHTVGPISALGIMLNSLTFTLLPLGLQWLGNAGGQDPSSPTLVVPLLMILAGGAIGALYIRLEQRKPLPMFPVDLLRLASFRSSMLISLMSFAAQTISFVALPFALLGPWHRSAAEAGLLMSCWPAAVMVAAAVAGRLIGRVPARLLGAAGLLAMAAGLALLAALPTDATAADLVWRMMLCGAGFGIFQSPNNHTMLATAPSHRAAAAGGLQGTARLTGQTIGGTIAMLVFSAAAGTHIEPPLLALGVASGFAALGGALSAMGLRRDKTASP